MDFFEEIGMKITKAGQKTKEITNNLADIAKLNSQMNEISKDIKNLYTKLGETYFQKFGISPLDGLEEICSEIQKNKEELEVLQNKINRLKGIRPCPNCGSGNSVDAKFCSNCSTQLPVIEEKSNDEGNFCPQCGNTVVKGMHFCSKCGCKLE